jgi:hypothetical protein
MTRYRGRTRAKQLQTYSRPAMYPEDFNTLDALARGAGISKPEMLRIALNRTIVEGETAYQAGQRIGRELVAEDGVKS